MQRITIWQQRHLQSTVLKQLVAFLPRGQAGDCAHPRHGDGTGGRCESQALLQWSALHQGHREGCAEAIPGTGGVDDLSAGHCASTLPGHIAALFDQDRTIASERHKHILHTLGLQLLRSRNNLSLRRSGLPGEALQLRLVGADVGQPPQKTVGEGALLTSDIQHNWHASLLRDLGHGFVHILRDLTLQQHCTGTANQTNKFRRQGLGPCHVRAAHDEDGIGTIGLQEDECLAGRLVRMPTS
mmetsp:Transcript_51216/g.130077  ORF Transcript_51216/g.130077 Transcript_51216/m.130077 type:complete len:242 (+) Transcript_51216:135-860(+)